MPGQGRSFTIQSWMHPDLNIQAEMSAYECVTMEIVFPVSREQMVILSSLKLLLNNRCCEKFQDRLIVLL